MQYYKLGLLSSCQVIVIERERVPGSQTQRELEDRETLFYSTPLVLARDGGLSAFC
jgi:hypothetical protein